MRHEFLFSSSLIFSSGYLLAGNSLEPDLILCCQWTILDEIVVQNVFEM
jgi:hypothetical protein